MSEQPKQKRKRDEKEAPRLKQKKKKAAQEEEGLVVRWQSRALQADLLVEKLRTLNPKMSSIEIGERSISEKTFVDTASWSSPQRNASDLPEFLEKVLPNFDFSTPTHSPGCPHTLIVSPAALRVADLTRVMKKFRSAGKAEVAKLFARHFKLSEHIKYVKTTPIHIAIGTPGRIKALVEAEDGALKLEKLRYLIIDANYMDGKKRTIFDIPETVRDLFGILGESEVRKRITKDTLKVVFY